MINLEKELIEKEQKYGGMVTNIPRNKVSILDPRTKKELETGGMVGGDRMANHGYAKKYAQYLFPIIKTKKPIILIEVGVLMGTGLAIWCDLFENGRIIGLDIDLSYIKDNMENLKKLGAFSKNQPELYEFDQFMDNAEVMSNILEGDKINICIDDGFHSEKSVLNTIKDMKPYLAEKFIYFIEDNKEIHKKIKLFYPNFIIDNEKEFTVFSNCK